MRLRLCFRIALFVVFLLPFAECLLPCGGYQERVWLKRVFDQLERRSMTTCDPVASERLEYTIARYNHVCPGCVRFSPCFGIARNIPWVPGVTLDPEVLTYDPAVGAEILYHEAQHDIFPWFGHSHFR